MSWKDLGQESSCSLAFSRHGGQNKQGCFRTARTCATWHCEPMTQEVTCFGRYILKVPSRCPTKTAQTYACPTSPTSSAPKESPPQLWHSLRASGSDSTSGASCASCFLAAPVKVRGFLRQGSNGGRGGRPPPLSGDSILSALNFWERASHLPQY